MQLNNSANTVLRYIVLGGIFLIPLLIPFIISKSMFFPFITGKNFAFRVIVEIIFGAWLILVWRDAAYRPRFSWILAALTVFVSIVAIADIFGENPLQSLWSNYERMDGLVTLLHLYALFLVAGSTLQDSRILWRRFLQISLFASVIICVYGIFQLLGYITINQGGVRVDATLGNATYLAIYLLFHIFFAAFLFVGEKRYAVPRFVYAAIFLLNLIILFNTATRGATLAFIGGMILIGLLVLFESLKNPSLRMPAVGILVSLFILVGGFMAIRDTDLVRNSQSIGRLANISIREGESRFLVWNMAWQGVKEHPILGWGQDNFILAFNKYYDPKMYGQEPWFDRAHNIVFDWLISAGILGLLSYLSLFFALLYAIWIYPHTHVEDKGVGVYPRRKFDNLFSPAEAFSLPERSVLTGLLAAYFFQNLFVFDNITSYFLFFLVLAFVHGRTTDEKPWFNTLCGRLFNDSSFVRRLVAPVVIVLVIVFVYSVNIRGISANKNLLEGIDLRSIEDAKTLDDRKVVIEKKLTIFEKSLKKYLGRTETREQLSQVAIAFAGAPVPEDLKQKFFTLARDELVKQIEEVPGNARYHLFLATLLTAYNLPDETIAYLTKALEVSPKKQNIHFIISNAYLSKGEFDKALAVLKEAFELEPRYGMARNLYASILIRSGQASRAEELLIEGYGTINVQNNDIINAYLAVGMFDRVISILQKKVEENPGDLQNHVVLSAAYLESGNRAKSIEKLRETILLFPAFKDQGEYFIKEIEAGKNP